MIKKRKNYKQNRAKSINENYEKKRRNFILVLRKIENQKR